jgi:aldehyde:ferredoxin oxidoreductase
MPFGYHGRILRVDLTARAWRVEEPPERFYRRYMGGSALGASYLLRLAPPGCEAFASENPLVLSLSVVTGAPISGLSRMTATAKSPLTGAIGDSQCGGFWPARCKFAGFDAIVIEGRSAVPVYLLVRDGDIEIRDARHLWGKKTGDVEDLLKGAHGDEVEVLQCGPAGEKLVRYASLINMCNRANGRTGMGAVMGSKRLKAVVVGGNNRPAVADPPALRRLARWGADKVRELGVVAFGNLGTTAAVAGNQAVGGIPTRNWRSGVFEGWESLEGQRMADTILVGRDTCFGCVIRCKRVVEVTEGPYRVDRRYGGPEYETIAMFGSLCGVDDLGAVAYANQLCNQYGMDTISCGSAVAWVMDCFERGLLTERETDGLRLTFGNAEAMVRLVEKIGTREGFGDLLAEGTRRAAIRMGRGLDLVVAVKGQDVPAHMPQVKRSCALIYGVNPFGADHQSHEHDPSYSTYRAKLASFGLLDPQPDSTLNAEKVRFSLYMQHCYSVADTLNLCQFAWGPAWPLYDLEQAVEMVRAVTGWNATLWELMKLGERRVNLMRAFNAREGFGAEADTLPSKMSIPLQGGPSNGERVPPEEFEEARSLYYAMSGWDAATGVPTRAKLEELGIGWVAGEHPAG